MTLAELSCKKEFNSLPLDDVVAAPNSVHYCVRLDNKLTKQIAEFVNSGRVIDLCAEDLMLTGFCHLLVHAKPPSFPSQS